MGLPQSPNIFSVFMVIKTVPFSHLEQQTLPVALKQLDIILHIYISKLRFIQITKKESIYAEKIACVRAQQVIQLCSTLCDSMDYNPPRLLCPWEFPGKAIEN